MGEKRFGLRSAQIHRERLLRQLRRVADLRGEGIGGQMLRQQFGAEKVLTAEGFQQGFVNNERFAVHPR